MTRRARARFAAPAAVVVAALSLAGCVSMPSGGPVQSDPVTQGTAAQDEPYVQIVPQAPGAGWSPTEIVQGFLTASASFGSHSEVALEYLTAQERKSWNPYSSAIVYKQGPNVRQTAISPAATATAPSRPAASATAASRPAASATAASATAASATAASATAASATAASPSAARSPAVAARATVQVTGQQQAYLKGNGSYSVPSAGSGTDKSPDPQPVFQLVQVGGQWRISSAPSGLLLTSNSFTNDYQQRYLYFLDPSGRYLVPDPVYVPLQAPLPTLMNGLVHDLISPPPDWLSGGATSTALPPGTKIAGVTLEGVTAVVNLAGAAISRAGNATLEKISSQLLWTLSSSAQSGQSAVQSVEVELNGKPWTPPGSPGNPVQLASNSKESPPSGATAVFYYVDSAGYLNSRAGRSAKPDRLTRLGAGYSQVAVSPDGRYVAALHGSALYTGRTAGGALTRQGSGYVSMSWDANDDLWATDGSQITVFRGTAATRQPLAQRIAVQVAGPGAGGRLTALRVAPDGVRVAIIIGGSELAFGAISGEQGAAPLITLSQVQLSPVNATTFTGLTWYGASDVIALASPGSVVTDYPVSGGASTAIPVKEGMESITASSGNLLIAALPGGQLWADVNLSSAWIPLGSGSWPVYPG